MSVSPFVNPVLITDRVRSTREGNVLIRVCPSIHPSIHLSVHIWGGGTRARSRGYPARGRTLPGYLTSGTAPSDLAGGYFARGTPPWVPPVRPGQRGYPSRGYPPVGPGQGGTLLGGYPTSGTTPVRPGWGDIPPGGTLPGGVPHLGYLPVRPGWAGPLPGVPHLRYPPVGPGWGYLPRCGTPPQVPFPSGRAWPGGTLLGGGGVPTSVNRWSRTFLFFRKTIPVTDNNRHFSVKPYSRLWVR